MKFLLAIFIHTIGVIAVAIESHRENEQIHKLTRRQDLISGLGGLVGGLGSLVGGLGSVLGGLTAPLLGPLVGNLVGVETGSKNKKGAPAPAPTPAPAPQVIVVPTGGSQYGPWQQQPQTPYNSWPQQRPQPAQPPAPASTYSWASWLGGGSQPASSKPSSDETALPAKSAEQTVTILGINVPCRTYPDDYSSDPQKSVMLSSPAKLDAVCWSGTTPGAFQSSWGKDDGWLMTKSNCFIKVSEVVEYRNYKTLLKPCQEVRHWVGTLSSQYSRKDCYYCPSTASCGSDDLATAPPYVDLLCYTNGENAGGNTTWYKNMGKNCYFPAAIFEPNGFLGTPGGRC